MRNRSDYREAASESNADAQATLKIVGGAQALSEQSLTNDIISERDDYVARVEPQGYVTVRIEFGNATYVQREPSLLALVNDKVGLKARSYFRKEAQMFGAFSGLDSEQALCCVRWSFVRKEEIHFAIERYVVVEIVGESTARAPTKSQVMTTKGKDMPANLVGWDFRVIRNLVLRLRNEAIET